MNCLKICVFLSGLCLTLDTGAQEWAPPLPPLPPDLCAEDPQRSDPVAAYQISGRCELEAVRPLGEYREGTAEVLEEIRDFRTTSTVRRLIGGQFRYLQQVKIELRRALEPPALLICHLDMFGKTLLDAKIVRTIPLENGGLVEREKVLELEGERLPDLGVYTHGKTIIRDADCN